MFDLFSYYIEKGSGMVFLMVVDEKKIVIESVVCQSGPRIETGTVNGKSASVLRDTVCTAILVSDSSGIF